MLPSPHTSLESIHASVCSADVLLIVPPLADMHRPALGVHILQACARAKGIDVGVHYSNLQFAADIGLANYIKLCKSPPKLLVGERLFTAAAYALPAFGHDRDNIVANFTLPDAPNGHTAKQPDAKFSQISLKASTLNMIIARAETWVDEVAQAVANGAFKVVGCSTMFEQTAASLALLNRIKQLRPDIVTIIGGPNCEGEMAEGIASLSPHIDYIFSGESEHTFVEFLQQLSAGELPANRIIRGRPLQNMEDLPLPDFGHYYQQLKYYAPHVASNSHIELAYETSRGCWWGQKHHCTFCGLNGEGMAFRAKSADKVLHELRELLRNHPSQNVIMTDNIMPYVFFKTLIPKLPELVEEKPALKIFYEQKANLSLPQVRALMAAGVTHIQPGIEALSTHLLKLMDKGVTAAQNIALMRYAHSVGMDLTWNLLNGFPGDKLEDYEETAAILPLLHHLQPPTAFFHLSVDRFSPYFERPQDYGIENIRPWDSYNMILPSEVDITRIAYHFDGDYESSAHRNIDILYEIQSKLLAWQAAWETHVSLFFGKFEVKQRPVLEVKRLTDNEFVLQDTRGLPNTQPEYRLTRRQASAALAPRRYVPTPEIEWAIAHKIGVVLDKHQYVPLATAAAPLIEEFELEVYQAKQKQPLFERSIPVNNPGLSEKREAYGKFNAGG